MSSTCVGGKLLLPVAVIKINSECLHAVLMENRTISVSSSVLVTDCSLNMLCQYLLANIYCCMT